MAKMTQTWNNVISYIKSQLGVPINMLEYTDIQIKEYLEEHTLQEFSEEFPVSKWVRITEADRLTDDIESEEDGRVNRGMFQNHEYAFKIPDLDDVNVQSIQEAYVVTRSRMAGASNVWNSNPFDRLIENGYGMMSQEFLAVHTHWFIPPRTVVFENSPFSGGTSSDIILEISGHYTALNQIDADMYQLFKKMCLLDILKLVRTLRSRYTSIETPSGTVALNTGYIEQQIQELDQRIQNDIDNIPPRILFDFLD